MTGTEDDLVEYGFRRVIITITAVLCALLEIVDTTIVNVALTNMRGSLGATLTDVAWVITAYAIANVIVIPMTSWLSQQFGRRNYFVVSIIIFTTASFLCGNATNIWELIAFRFIQGLGGGALLVTAQTIITESYPLAKRGMAQAIYGMGVIVGPTLGPPLGGYLVDNYSWPYIFYINIPLGIIAAILIALANATIGLVLRIFTFPLNILTLGLISFIITVLMILLVDNFMTGFNTTGFLAAAILAIAVSVIKMLLDSIFGVEKK